ncbi:type II toxin-antitoxin system VapC family toxin [Bacillus cereus]|uniref:type II toxin-antitoxin system VapC family toxin n=1 Tax=Bacillus cereus TaxID=1396 RepID=UPI00027ABAE9|nr:type II toxin-antitoxin system VapC family toxin [Bacillus cereus]EJS72887.1 hypothetical protein ICY_04098 [Bacillus cereus BAG2X1-3]
MNSPLNISTYEPSSQEKFFFDTNVWLYLFCPIGGYRSRVVNGYSQFFYKLLKSNSNIYTSSMILSEFFNAYIRLEFKMKQQEKPEIYKDFKRDFRQKEEYIELSNYLCQLINGKILKYTIPINDEFDNLKPELFLQPSAQFDFNDNYIAQLCLKNNLKVVSNDRDLRNISSDLKVISLLR